MQLQLQPPPEALNRSKPAPSIALAVPSTEMLPSHALTLSSKERTQQKASTDSERPRMRSGSFDIVRPTDPALGPMEQLHDFFEPIDVDAEVLGF